MTPLLFLAEKVEGLSGPDREVDADIAVAIRWSPAGVDARLFFNEDIRPLYAHRVLAYTASLDAAMSLVPEGVRFRLGHDEDVAGVFMAQCTYSLAPTRSGFVVAYSRSAACALVAASLRARAAMEAGE